MRQLEIYQKSKFKVTKKDKHVRTFYMERAVQEVLSTYPIIYNADHHFKGDNQMAMVRI